MRAFISGLSGQDGSYLSELLLSKGYEVGGIIRRHAIEEQELGNSTHLKGQISTFYADLTDANSLREAIDKFEPDEVYHLGAQSHVGISSKIPALTMQINETGTLNMLDAVRLSNTNAKFYNAASSEIFGNSIDDDGFQRETTPMHPVSPYAVSKLAAFHLVKHYRVAYNMFCCNGILFNHESPRRGKAFVTQKVVEGAVNIYYGRQKTLELGNLDSSRDWSHAKDMVYGMWLMMQYNSPDDWILSSGSTYSIRELCTKVFGLLGMDYTQYVVTNPEFVRPQELNLLKGDSSKARTVLGWKPAYNFDLLIEDMVESCLKRLR